MKIRISGTLICAASLILWVGFHPNAAAQAQKPSDASSQKALDDLYAKAVADAMNPEPGEVRDLIPITLDNDRLIWGAFDGKPYVLTVSWVSNTSYYAPAFEKEEPYNTGSYNIWVTAAPQVQQICSRIGFGGDDLDLRLRQLLGLPAQDPKAAFVEFWVRPQDLFRPCPDAEVDDRSCGLSLPEDVTPQYRLWFNDLRSQQYFQSTQPDHDAYPWTQLGYTYDWSPQAARRGQVGPSEFVIRRNSTVRIRGIVPTGKYCERE